MSSNALERAREASLRLAQTDNSDDLSPLLKVIGAISAIFWAGMMADHIGPLLRTQAAVEVARTHATALILTPAITCISLAVVAFLRVVAGPFDVRLRRLDVNVRSGAVAFFAFFVCVLMEVAIVKLLW